MKTRAAVAFEAKKPLEIIELDLEGPKAGMTFSCELLTFLRPLATTPRKSG